MSAISIDNISKAVPESSPFVNTPFDIESGFSSTFLCVIAEPIVVTIPSPTRAIMVSSVAPPTNRSMFALTVTRAFALSWIPSIATASIVCLPLDGSGQSITLGLTLVLTASRTSLPARSIAQALSKPSSIFALSAAINALITLGTLPLAR